MWTKARLNPGINDNSVFYSISLTPFSKEIPFTFNADSSGLDIYRRVIDEWVFLFWGTKPCNNHKKSFSLILSSLSADVI